MEEIRVINITITELQRMLDESAEKAVQKAQELQTKPSEYEEITLEQAAAELKCSVRTISRRMKKCHVKGYRVGKEITIQRKDLPKIKKAS